MSDAVSDSKTQLKSHFMLVHQRWTVRNSFRRQDGQVVCVTLTGHLLAQINDTYPITNKEQHRKE